LGVFEGGALLKAQSVDAIVRAVARTVAEGFFASLRMTPGWGCSDRPLKVLRAPPQLGVILSEAKNLSVVLRWALATVIPQPCPASAD